MKKPVQHDAVQLQIVQLVHQLITEEDVCEDDNTLYDIKFSQNIWDITNSQVVTKIFTYTYFSRLLFVRFFIMIKWVQSTL